MTEPNVELFCLDCGRSTSGDIASSVDWYDYDLLPDGIAAVKSARIWEEGTTASTRRECKLRDFKLLVNQILVLSRRTGRPLSAARLTIQTGELTSTIGPRGVAAVRELVRDIAAQNMREYDISATLPDAILVCMPETDHEAARLVVDRIYRAVVAAVRPKPTVKVEVFPLSQLDQLLQV
jgi:hypothetical protein